MEVGCKNIMIHGGFFTNYVKKKDSCEINAVLPAKREKKSLN
jgi:hypothetical protein